MAFRVRALPFLVSCLLITNAAVKASEPSPSGGKARGLQVSLADGSQFHIQLNSSGSASNLQVNGIFKDLQTSRVCTFEGKDDFLWWQSALDIGCGDIRVRLRTEMPDLKGVSPGAPPPGAITVYKLMAGDDLYVYAVEGVTPLDSTAFKKAQAALKGLPAHFAATTRSMQLLASPQFLSHFAPMPSGLWGFFEMRGEPLVDFAVDKIQPLTTEQSDALVREAIGKK